MFYHFTCLTRVLDQSHFNCVSNDLGSMRGTEKNLLAHLPHSTSNLLKNSLACAGSSLVRYIITFAQVAKLLTRQNDLYFGYSPHHPIICFMLQTGSRSRFSRRSMVNILSSLEFSTATSLTLVLIRNHAIACQSHNLSKSIS